MKKKVLTLFAFTIMLLALMPLTALASASVTTDKTSALPGETVSISGTASSGENVVIKIMDEAGNIVFFDAIKADASGKYSTAFIVSSDMAAGKLTVTAGSGNDVATAAITVKPAPQSPAKPANKPESNNYAEPTADPSASSDAGDTAEPSNTDKGDETDMAQTGGSYSGGWRIAVYIASGLLILAAAIWILLHQRNKRK